MITSSKMEKFKKAVTFIYLESKGEKIPNGTGFFVSVRYQSESNLAVYYLVTAKHVIQNKTGGFFPEIFTRLSLKTGELIFLKLVLSDESVLTHEDSDIDVAVVPIKPNETIDFLGFDSDLIPDESLIEKLEVEEGDDIFFAGLFRHYLGQKKNQPVIRYGKIALMPDEKIEWEEPGKPKKELDLYLMECPSYGGNSGSPAFVDLRRIPISRLNRIKEHKELYLMGIVMGNFNEGMKIKDLKSKKEIMYWQNVGVTALIPSYKLREILFSEKAEQQRVKALEDYKNKKT